MKFTSFFFLAICICNTSYAQTELLLLPKDSVVMKMASAHKNWDFNKQSEEFTNGVSYDLYEYSNKAKDAGDLTFLFDKNGLCIRVMYLNSLKYSDGLVEWADKNFTRSGENTWVDPQTKETIQGTLKRNEGASSVSIEFVNLLYKPAL